MCMNDAALCLIQLLNTKMCYYELFVALMSKAFHSVGVGINV